MNWPDIVNGTLEALSGVMVLNHCRVLRADRRVAGVSIASVAFFTFWGVWNLFYYPALGQLWSLAGGVVVMAANGLYVAMLLHYTDGLRDARQWLARRVCRVRGCHFNAMAFRSNALYFCTRCGEELTGRTFEDLVPMSDEDLEEMHRDFEMNDAEARS
jgi:hypothetical protein